MAVNDSDKKVIDLLFQEDPANIERIANEVTAKFTASFARGLSNGLNAAIATFGKTLGSSIEVAFNTTVLGALKKPIVIKLDTDDAQKKIDALVKPLQNVVGKVREVTSPQSKSTSKTSTLTADEQSAKSTSIRGDIGNAENAIKTLGETTRKKLEESLKPIKDLFNNIKSDSKGLFTAAQIKELDDVAKKLKVIEDEIVRIQQAEVKNKNLQNQLTPAYLNQVNEELNKQRLNVSALGPPLGVVIKQTRQYDSTLITIEKNLEDTNREYKKWQDTLGKEGISLDQASKQYKKIADDLRKLEVGIEQIDGNRIKKVFDLEQADPRQLSYRLGILGFTLQTVGGTLQNFARTAFQSISQLAQAAEPIERVNNALALQVKQGEITAEQQGLILQRLRDVGDLPGSSVEDANKTFNSLQKVNISLARRLDLTEGIAKLAASPGGEPGSGEQVTNALLNLANKGGKVDSENFKTLRVQGGRVFAQLNESLGLNSAKDLEKFGVQKYLNDVAKALNNLESPAETTTDRFNRLTSRLSEFGVILGKVIGPGLDRLNLFLRNTLQPILTDIGRRFDALTEG